MIAMLKPLIIENGIIQPSFGKKKHCRFLRRYHITAGVLTSAGLPVCRSKAIIMEREVVSPSRVNPSEIQINHIDEDAIYFCIPQNHFGHTLVGTMSFAHILLDTAYKRHKIVFIDRPPSEQTLILLEHLGAKRENIMTVNEYTSFKSVTVVKQSLYAERVPRLGSVPYRISLEFIDTFRAIAQKFNDTNGSSPKKIYFSRGMLPGKTILCEDKIEQVFKKNGYEILYPERLSLNEQIKLVANADFYACVQSSLEHHSLFMKDGATAIVMSRKEIPTERQVLIKKLQKTIKHINLSTNVRPMGDKFTPNIIGATKDLICFFEKYNFLYDIDELKPTYQDFKIYIDKCFSDNRERILKYIRKRLIKCHNNFWKQIK